MGGRRRVFRKIGGHRVEGIHVLHMYTASQMMRSRSKLTLSRITGFRSVKKKEKTNTKIQ